MCELLLDWLRRFIRRQQACDVLKRRSQNRKIKLLLARAGSVAKFSVGLRAISRKDEMTSQAATWNSPAMNCAWALMSLPPMF